MLMKDVAKNYKKAPGKHGRDDTSTEVYGKTVSGRYQKLQNLPKVTSGLILKYTAKLSNPELHSARKRIRVNIVFTNDAKSST